MHAFKNDILKIYKQAKKKKKKDILKLYKMSNSLTFKTKNLLLRMSLIIMHMAFVVTKFIFKPFKCHVLYTI